MKVNGVILILSCQKHLKTRLEKFKLSKNQYLDWKVIYVIGDLSISDPYQLREGNMLYIKCEDSYLHLLKKLALAIKYVSEIYIIKEGILRCGDDLIFNEKRLEEFLQKEKSDFFGKSDFGRDNLPRQEELRKKKMDNWMLKYYSSHGEDFSNPKHGLKDFNTETLKKYSLRPDIWGPHGVIYYISKKAANIIVKELEKVNFNILHYDEFSGSYPYTIEDVGVTYIMYRNGIKFTDSQLFFDSPNAICCHTNMLK